MFAGCRNGLAFTAENITADCAVCYKVVRTFGAAGGFNSVFFSRCGGMTLCVNVRINVAVFAYGAGVSRESFGCAGRSRYNVNVAVTESRSV